MERFGERLSDIMFERNIIPEKMAKDLGISLSTVYRWKSNKTKIFLSNLVILADYLNCSIDYILGISDDISNFTKNNDLPKFSMRLREVMKEKGISTYKLRKISSYDGKYFEKWDNGTDPTAFNLANILDCTVDFLVGRN